MNCGKCQEILTAWLLVAWIVQLKSLQRTHREYDLHRLKWALKPLTGISTAKGRIS